jgi:hypothetical protein
VIGDGGGVIELGAVGTVAIGGSVLAAGGNAGGSPGSLGTNGGGGGGVFVHGYTVEVAGLIDASGGGGGQANGPTAQRHGAGGGGGRVLIEYGPGGLLNTGVFDVTGGSSPFGVNQPGGIGVVTFSPVPEPGLTLAAAGLAGVVGYEWRSRRIRRLLLKLPSDSNLGLTIPNLRRWW